MDLEEECSPRIKRRKLSSESDGISRKSDESLESIQNIRVVARVRPLSSKEILEKSKETIVAFEASSTIAIVNDRKFEFDQVFSPLASQAQVYDKTAADLVRRHLFSGFNVTVLAYGQTGSGKTHTMLGGTFGKDPSDHEGITARAIRDVFACIGAMSTHNRVTVEMSYLEIYNEDVRDLLTNETKPQELFLRDTKDGVMVQNLTWKCVESPASVSELMMAAGARRATGSTAMNAESSRSHAICTLSIHMKAECESEEIRAKLTLVDLAGSERIKRTGAEGSRMKEGININKGLFVLGQVVSALSEMSQQNSFSGNGSVQSNGHSHVKYRDSKLTRLLQDSLGGNSKTVMVACVSPADTNLEESLNTLRYASRARNIKNSAIRNIVDSSLSASEAAALREENQKLKLQILQLQTQSHMPTFGHSASTAMFQFMPLLSSTHYSNDGKEESMDIDNPFSLGLEADASKENDESFDSTQHSLKNELVAMSGTIEEKEQMVKQISIDREQIESMKVQVQAAIGALQHEVDTLSKERDELLSKCKSGSSRSTPNTKVNERISLLENKIKALKEKLADHSKVLRQREEAEKKCTQLMAEINDDKRKRASLQRKLKEISEERRAEKKAAAMNAAKMLRDSQKLKCELTKVKEAAARQEAVFKRKTAEAMLKRSRRTPSNSLTESGISLERKEELISWIDKEISSSSYLNNLKTQIDVQTKRYQDLRNQKAQLGDPMLVDRTNKSRSLDAELAMISEMIAQLEKNVEEVMSICSNKPSGSSIPFLDETIWNTLSLSDLRFVAVSFFERYQSLSKTTTTEEAEVVEQEHQSESDETILLQSTVDNLLKSADFSKSDVDYKKNEADIVLKRLPALNPFLRLENADDSPIQDDEGGSLDDSSDSDWSPTKIGSLSKTLRSKKNSSSDSIRSVNNRPSVSHGGLNFDGMTKPELQAELRARGLAVSGTKAELQSRLSSASTSRVSSAGNAHAVFSASLRSTDTPTKVSRPATRNKRPPLPSANKATVPSKGRPSSAFNPFEMKTSLVVFDDEYDAVPTKIDISNRAQSSQSSVRRSMRLSHAPNQEKENRPHTSDTALRRSSFYSKPNDITAGTSSLSDSAKKKRRRSMAESVNRALMQLDMDGNFMKTE